MCRASCICLSFPHRRSTSRDLSIDCMDFRFLKRNDAREADAAVRGPQSSLQTWDELNYGL